eukprot:CAMPEP_0204610852 /NCGR_PEP_ID=MMETSP0661-20131031/61720_1 /ASSEMBLY_ACC=CAM_ASM_000606 /TAXON_ID=109239 /ORGANISM="Alexandrium margalefi, Strain AMGDE01CS-322" /LENGTH=133 /DNA_ID=CAMNT_0051622679 /DNA_START=169 /DNA_END=571 /DNA_ORIENTATION=+
MGSAKVHGLLPLPQGGAVLCACVRELREAAGDGPEQLLLELRVKVAPALPARAHAHHIGEVKPEHPNIALVLQLPGEAVQGAGKEAVQEVAQVEYVESPDQNGQVEGRELAELPKRSRRDSFKPLLVCDTKPR